MDPIVAGQTQVQKVVQIVGPTFGTKLSMMDMLGLTATDPR
jgi:hypothetical protein